MSRSSPTDAPGPLRALAVWCDQWPVIAAGASPDLPVAVVRAGRVVAATPAAMEAGVAAGQRRREAQGRCPDIELLPFDDRSLAAAFEPVVAAVTAFSPTVEVGRPGDCVLASRGPARYFATPGHGGATGGPDGDSDAEMSLARQVGDAVDAVLADMQWPNWVRVAVADGAVGSRLVAAHLGVGGRPLVVPAGGTARALSALPVRVVVTPEVVAGVDPGMAGLLGRLGLGTVGAFASLEPADVLARFGGPAMMAHALARGVDDRPAAAQAPPAELVVVATLDPPVERADALAFAARPLADDFHRRLASRGSTTSVVTVEFETDHGEACSRLWRYDASPAGLVDRVRWQLDGWLSGPVAARPTAGVVRLRLVPGEVVPATGRQLGFWGEETAADQRAARVVARIDALLGPGSVAVPGQRGGRSPAEQVVRVPAGVAAATGRQKVPGVEAPWPGSVPPPPPGLVHDPPWAVEVLDAEGAMVCVDGRSHLSAAPARVGRSGHTRQVVAWAGPWPADERWWDPVAHRRRARLQVQCVSGPPLLVACEGGRWWCEATYD